MLKICLLFKKLSNFTGIYNSRILRIKKAKLSGYCFNMNANKQGDFQICISVHLIGNRAYLFKGQKNFEYDQFSRSDFFLLFLFTEKHLITPKPIISQGGPTSCRSSRPEVFLGKGVLKICGKFTGEHPCRSAISIKLQSKLFQLVIFRLTQILVGHKVRFWWQHIHQDCLV